MTSARLLSESTYNLNKSLVRLSSGSKIISPEDDVGGLAVSVRFEAQISRIGSIINNVRNEISYAQTQDSFLDKIGSALDRMSELSTLAMDATKNDTDRAKYQTEFDNLRTYVSDLAAKEFNAIALFGVGTDHDVVIDENDGTNTYTRTLVDLSNITSAIAADDISTTAGAVTALVNTTQAIDDLSTHRANVGADISYFTTTVSHMTVLQDKLATANSRIKDVDVAAESTLFARYNILVQSGTAMVAQANIVPQSALRLLGG